MSPPRSEWQRIARWALIGLLSTVVHVMTVTALVEALALPPVPANGLAFVVASLFSFRANGRYTFGQAASWPRFVRFLGVALVGLLLAVGASSLAEALQWHYRVGVLLTVLLLPALTYLAHRLWTWA